jgi:hypothetical protein
VNGFTFEQHEPQRLERTKLTELCQGLERSHSERLTRQQVRLRCDVDPNLVCDLPQPLIRQILEAWIDEALTMMPSGGELDLTFVPSRHGLEIEVADSRETDLHESQSYWHRNVQIRNGSMPERVAGAELRVEAAVCPQGGLARTVTVTRHAAAAGGTPTGTWRKVA